jgi:hypothetical protein
MAGTPDPAQLPGRDDQHRRATGAGCLSASLAVTMGKFAKGRQNFKSDFFTKAAPDDYHNDVLNSLNQIFAPAKAIQYSPAADYSDPWCGETLDREYTS